MSVYFEGMNSPIPSSNLTLPDPSEVIRQYVRHNQSLANMINEKTAMDELVDEIERDINQKIGKVQQIQENGGGLKGFIKNFYRISADCFKTAARRFSDYFNYVAFDPVANIYPIAALNPITDMQVCVNGAHAGELYKLDAFRQVIECIKEQDKKLSEEVVAYQIALKKFVDASKVQVRCIKGLDFLFLEERKAMNYCGEMVTTTCKSEAVVMYKDALLKTKQMQNMNHCVTASIKELADKAVVSRLK